MITTYTLIGGTCRSSDSIVTVLGDWPMGGLGDDARVVWVTTSR